MQDYKKEHFLSVKNVQICGVAISYVWLSVTMKGAFLFGYYVTKKEGATCFRHSLIELKFANFMVTQQIS
jgi:hypothetical protein